MHTNRYKLNNIIDEILTYLTTFYLFIQVCDPGCQVHQITVLIPGIPQIRESPTEN